MSTDPRAAAHAILRDVARGEFVDRAAGRELPRVAPRDRGLVMELAYGAVRLRNRLDTWIEALTDRPLRRIDGPVLDWLRLGMYQLRELRVPDHAAVGETVRNASRTMDAGRVGFINAVLRSAAGGAPREDPFPSREADPVGYLTTWGSHPEWLVRRWLDRWGWHDAWRLVKHGNVAPLPVLRLLEDLDCEGAARRVGDGLVLRALEAWPRSCELLEGSPEAALDRLRAVVQDPAASAVVEYAGRVGSGAVYDACAAPGTKAMVLASEGPDARPYVAADVSPGRLGRVAESAARLRLPVRCAAMDARRPALRAASTVLVDAPCTGTGVLRRRPDARWRVDADRLASLCELQREILDACADVVKPGGLLIYATCSLEPEENEVQIAEFLARHGAFHREPTAATLQEDTLTSDGDLFVRPWLTGTDGAYAARLRREAA